MFIWAISVRRPRESARMGDQMWLELGGVGGWAMAKLSAKTRPFLADKGGHLNTIGCHFMSISVIDLRHGRLKSK